MKNCTAGCASARERAREDKARFWASVLQHASSFGWPACDCCRAKGAPLSEEPPAPVS